MSKPTDEQPDPPMTPEQRRKFRAKFTDTDVSHIQWHPDVIEAAKKYEGMTMEELNELLRQDEILRQQKKKQPPPAAG